MYRSLAYKSGVGQEKEDSVGKGKKKRKDVDLCKYSVVRKREDERWRNIREKPAMKTRWW